MTDMLFLFVIKQNTKFFWTLYKKKKKKKLARMSLLSNKIHKAGLFIKLAVLFQEFF